MTSRMVAGLPGLVTPAAAGPGVGPFGRPGGGGAPNTFAITVGTDGTSYGWDPEGPFGGVAPDPALFESGTEELVRLVLDTSFPLIQIRIEGAVTPGIQYWDSVVLQGTGGPITLMRADAAGTASPAPNTRLWNFTEPEIGSLDWTADVGEVRQAAFTLP